MSFIYLVILRVSEIPGPSTFEIMKVYKDVKDAQNRLSHIRKMQIGMYNLKGFKSIKHKKDSNYSMDIVYNDKTNIAYSIEISIERKVLE